jgi:hypothetical protein
MSYLQLADNGYSHLAARSNEMYVFIPQGFRGATADSYVREDVFDKMHPEDYDQIMMELLPYQNMGMSELGDRASRKAKRAGKKEARAGKKEARATKKEGRGAAARGERKLKRQESRQAAKTERAQVRAASGGGGFLDKITGAVGGILNKDASIDVGGASVEYDAPSDESFMSKYKTPLLIGGGLLAIGAILLLTKKKK